MTAGKFFEHLCLDFFAESLKDGFRAATEEEDRYNSTDCYLYGVPTDITLRFINEKFGAYSIGRVRTGAYTINVGLRARNEHREFDHPVMVLSFELYVAPSEATHLIALLDVETLDKCFGLYWDAVDGL